MILNIFFWLAISIFLTSLGCETFKTKEPKVYFERSWTRKTTPGEYQKQRNINRMKPLLNEKYVIQGNGTSSISSYDRSTGNLNWSVPIENGVEAGIASDNKNIYFGANDGFFYSVSKESGKVNWKQDLKSESNGEPLIQGNYIYHMTSNNTLYSFEADSGRILWVKTQSQKSDFSLRGSSRPVFHNGKIFVGFSDGTFRCLDAISGNESWVTRLGDDKKFTDVDAAPVITDDCLLISSFANSLFCIDTNKGSVKWSVPEGGIQKVTIGEQGLYYPTVNNNILVLDAKSGKIIKKISTHKGLLGPVIELNNWLLFAQSDNGVVIYDLKSEKIVDEFKTGRGVISELAVDEKKREVYFISNDAILYKLNIVSKNFDFPWKGSGNDKNFIKKL